MKFGHLKTFFRLASADYSGFVRVWKISDILQAFKGETERLLRQQEGSRRRGRGGGQEKTKIVPDLFVHHRSLYTHRGAVTAVRLDSFALASVSRDRSACLWNFAENFTFY